MACYSQMTAYKLLNRSTQNGKSEIVFDRKGLSKDAYLEIKIPCGQCIGCRIAKSREWAVRCVHEASLYAENAFITLTYSPENLPVGGSLTKGQGSDYQLFMKRLRKHAKGITAVQGVDGEVKYPIRFFQCGEYGDQLRRPHHHSIIFNYGFPDKYLWSVRNGSKYYRSPFLESLWKYGHSIIGDVTWASAAYVGRYVTKKFTGPERDSHYRVVDDETGELNDLVPEYVTMSRRPGIGYDWFQKYGCQDIYGKDYLTIGGKKFMSPRYYDTLLERKESSLWNKIKQKRFIKAGQKVPDPIARQLVEKKCLELKTRRLMRGYENDSENVQCSRHQEWDI